MKTNAYIMLQTMCHMLMSYMTSSLMGFYIKILCLSIVLGSGVMISIFRAYRCRMISTVDELGSLPEGISLIKETRLAKHSPPL